MCIKRGRSVSCALDLFGLHVQITAKHLQRVVHAVDVAAFVTVAGVNAGADQTVTDVIAGAQGSFHVAAVVGIHVHCVVRAGFLGGGDQLANDIVAVRATESLAQMDTCFSVHCRPSPTQPISTEMASVTPAGMEPQQP